MINDNIILLTDSYKPSHWKQYPPETKALYSYFESRGGFSNEVVFFGLYQILRRYLAGEVVTHQKIDEAKAMLDSHLRPGVFNEAGWLHIVRDHKGALPLQIEALPEGSVLAPHNALFTVQNTCPKCAWLVSYVETLLVQTWYPSTVATLAREAKRVIRHYLEQTADNTGGLEFKLHDFGVRGTSSMESAAIGGAAHLTQFKGSDNLPAIRFLQDFYWADEMPAFSIPAAEHSTITSFGRDRERAAFLRMLYVYDDGPIAVVSDSYDIFNAVEHIWGEELKDDVLDHNGTVVIRPDSGDPVETCLKVIGLLGQKFGTVKNQKGYRELIPQVRIIQGDGVNLQAIEAILSTFKHYGWSADNIAFGMGGGLLQKVDREWLNFTYKASAWADRGEWLPISKSPVGASWKASKAGAFKVVPKVSKLGSGVVLGPDDYETVDVRDPRVSALGLVFSNGAVIGFEDLESIRRRSAL